MQNKKTVAVIGLGSMGYGIAQSLLRAGHNTYGYDINPETVSRFQLEGGSKGNLKDVASTFDSVVVVVLNSEQTETVLFDNKIGVVDQLKAGCVILSCATVAPEFAQKMELECQKRDVHYLDSPISGGSKKAANGQLSIMASGTPKAFSAARPVLDATASTVFELGDKAGAGSAMKAVNQLLAGVHIAAMAEAITFGITQGVSPNKFVEVISKCAGTSWMLENRAPHIASGDYTPHSSVNIWPKDLGIVLEIAKSAKFSAPLTAAAMQQFLAASGSGLGDEDDAAVAKVYARNSGLTLPGEKKC
ncbi:3-hydroxyisobutyrate dehydrogenase [Marinomonas ushuaiensis DSM 15871]|uniref:L-threonate dehydrogenase n=1 Tax=Marinomonas ushuaiensis DSM 15871 TaxID=1122207 RepID=X7E3D0_9GAMM|nr:L-threonate dehydrogenase [Marinomonas ushuaiensis]ETX09683.1 3-hydroxyisobutyrate dehydrogenase [Marinomonas ushuaiensis DSM 15871]